MSNLMGLDTFGIFSAIFYKGDNSKPFGHVHYRKQVSYKC